MSWQDYVNNNLLGTQTCKYALLAGHDGNIWAEGGDLAGKVTSDELKKIISGFDNPSAFQASGAFLGGEKYIFLSADSTMRLKKGTGGAFIVKTGTAIILVTYDDSIQPGQCSAMVEKLGDYLRTVGY